MNDRIDLLNRENFVGNVIKIINQMSHSKKGCCFAIEGAWGIGKTFVIEEIEEILRIIQSEETNSDIYFVFHYNCWQYDYYDEPAVAIISAMISSNSKDNAVGVNVVKAGCEIAVDKLKEIAGLFIENKIGVNLISIVEDIKKKKDEEQASTFAFDQMFNFSQTIEEARRNLQEIAKHRTIVLVVDELDRCIPGYAIKVLERLHHIFYGLENVVVIIAIDRKQLEHSVEEMFGAKNDNGTMDIEKYLKKFIDFSVELDNGKVNELLSEKYDFYFQKFVAERPYDNENMNDILTVLLSKIDIRSQEKIIEKANLVHSLICNEKVHLSVLVFEIMFEIAKKWGLSMSNIIEIRENMGAGLINQKVEAIKYIVEKAYDQYPYYDGRQGRRITDSVYGDVYYYFWRIFNNQTQVFVSMISEPEKLDKGEKILKKYCEFCELIK